MILGALLGAASVASAEDALAEPKRTIEEIVVTAQKKEERLQDVPISITAIAGDFLQKTKIDTFHELAEFAPNVHATTDACCSTVYIRGFGSPLSPSAFEPSVGFAIDELSIPRGEYVSDPFYDLARVEVLRGPQGALFGKNTTAGLFHLVTESPTRELTGYVLARIGGLGVHRAEAAFGGPIGSLGDIAQFRFALVDLQEAGDVENTKLHVREPAAKQTAGRLKLGVHPLTSLEILLTGELAITDSRPFHAQQENLRDSSVRFLRRFDPEFEDDGFNHQNSIDQKHHVHRRTNRAQANIHYLFDESSWMRKPELAAVLGYTPSDADLPFDVDSSPADIIKIDSPSKYLYKQRSAELRFSELAPAPFDLGEVELLAGFLVFDADFSSNSPFRAGKDLGEYLLSAPGFEVITGMQPPGGLGFDDINAVAAALGVNPIANLALLEGDGARVFLAQQTRSQALFGQVAWHPSNQWTVSFAGRLTHESKDAHLVNQCFQPGFVCAAFMIEQFDVNRHRSETDFSPKLSVQYFPSESLSLFATRAQGFKSGGYNNVSFTQAEIEVGPEKAVSLEAGAKGTLFDEKLGYGATLFNADVDDLQIQTIQGTRLLVRNAASARSRGIELDFRWLTPWKPLRFDGSGALTDARYKRFPNAPAPPGSGSPEQDLSGRRMPFVPKAQLHVSPSLTFGGPDLPLIGGLVPRDLLFTAALDVLYRSSMFLRVDLGPHTRQDAYTMLDGRIGISVRDDKLWLGVTVKNITNTDALEFATDSVFFPPGLGVIQEFQRNYAFAMKYAW